MKLIDHLSKENEQRLNHMRRKTKRAAKPREEALSHREWLDIMGANRDTYKRVNGAVRRR